jgi:hypothetical protein
MNVSHTKPWRRLSPLNLKENLNSLKAIQSKGSALAAVHGKDMVKNQ